MPSPVIVAAGLVKGNGYASEKEAVEAVNRGENIMPGWRSVPELCGLVEFGSFTAKPRVGNSGRILWRDSRSRSLYNRVGLRNSGVKAAARFIKDRASLLPNIFGVSIASVLGDCQLKSVVEDAVYSAAWVREVKLTWVTVNLVCPNVNLSVSADIFCETAGKNFRRS